MSQNKDEDDDLLEIEVELDELDADLMSEITDSLEIEIQRIFNNNITKDGRKELMYVLLSLSATLMVDTGGTLDDLLDLVAYFYDEAEVYLAEETNNNPNLN